MRVCAYGHTFCGCAYVCGGGGSRGMNMCVSVWVCNTITEPDSL